MATNTLLQRLPTPGEAFTDLNESNRRQIETFIAGEAIAINQAVCFDMSKANDAEKVVFVKVANTTAATSCCIGIAREAAAANARVDVIIGGITEFVASGSVTAGDSLSVSTAGAETGRLRTYTASYTQPIVAYAVDSATTGQTRTAVFYKRF
jgi:hypothetical protein